ncbi:hypothetical protein MG293_001798 [Ovis ammon polii]|uniref:Uncharacterized protein n=1 Tax=Ovis ammon polii TaxID=230172 RepID=A0AAD4ULN5_OVIAM|nr:hypothetical protein MG293_001798 [Ovis ammon polii]
MLPADTVTDRLPWLSYHSADAVHSKELIGKMSFEQNLLSGSLSGVMKGTNQERKLEERWSEKTSPKRGHKDVKEMPERVIRGTARRGQDSGAPVAPASLRPGGRPLSRAEATAARFLGLCDGPERERELPPETTPGDAARRIDRGWELRARTFRKSTGASSGAAPPPPPARLPFRVVTQPVGYAEVCAETRNLRAAGSACLRRRSPGPHGAHPSPAPGLAQGAGAGDALRGLHFSEVRGILGREREAGGQMQEAAVCHIATAYDRGIKDGNSQETGFGPR